MRLNIRKALIFSTLIISMVLSATAEEVSWGSSSDWSDSAASGIKVDGDEFELDGEQVEEEQIQIIDDFSRGDRTPYEYVRDGEDGFYVSQSNSAIKGDYVLTGSGSSDSPAAMAFDGLEYFPEVGDTVAYYLRSWDTSNVAIMIGGDEDIAFNGPRRQDDAHIGNEYWRGEHTFEDNDGTERVLDWNGGSASRNGDWYKIEADWTSTGFDVRWYHEDDSFDSPIHTESFSTSGHVSEGGLGIYVSNERGAFEVDKIHAIEEVNEFQYDSSGSLVTEHKSFGEDIDIDTLELTDLSYSTNDETIQARVQGAEDEWSDWTALSGSSESIDGLTTHTDTFKIQFDLSTSDETTSPEMDSASLTGDTANEPPEIEEVVNPEDNEEIVGLNPDLEVDVYDPDSDNMDVTFYEGSVGTDEIGSVSASNTENAVLDTSGLDIGSETGTQYSWSVEATDGEEIVQSDTWSFTTIHEPDAPTNPSPSDQASDIRTDTDLEVDVSHSDGLDMDVTFRINNGSGWTTGGTDTGVESGSTASISPDLDLSENYEWYAEASASGHTTQSDTWSFETEHNFEIEDLRPSAGEDKVAVDPVLEADILHSSSSETVDVTFYEYGGSELGTDTVTDGETAFLDTEGLDFGSEPGTSYEYYVEASDGQSGTEDITTETALFTTLHPPDDPEVLNPTDSENIGLDSDFEIEVSHPDNDEMSVEISLTETDGSFVDDMFGEYSNGVISSFDPELSYDTEYELVVEASVTDSGGEVHTASNSASFSTEVAPDDLAEPVTNNTNPQDGLIEFDLAPSVTSITLIDHEGDTAGIQSDPSSQASIDLLGTLDDDIRYEWTAEVTTSDETRIIDFSFTTITVDVELEDEIDEASNYGIYRAETEEGSYSKTGEGEFSELIDVSEGLLEGETFCYRATAITEEGLESSLSDPVCLEDELEVSAP